MKKSKKKIVEWILIISSVIVSIVAAIVYLVKNKNQKTTAPVSITSPTVEPTKDAVLGDLGIVITPTPTPTNKNDKVYGDTPGDIKQEEIVQKGDKNYKDQTAVDKSDMVGNIITDTKNGTLEVKPNGEVHIKNDIGYEVKDENGAVIDSGSNNTGIPDGDVYDKNLDSYVKEEDLNKYIYLDADYYDKKGNLVLKKGTLIAKETLEKLKNELNLTTLNSATKQPVASTSTPIPTTTPTEKPTSTSIPTTTPTQKPTSTSNPTTTPTQKPNLDEFGGVVNEDGTYTIDGLTFIDKDTFITIINGECDETSIRYNEDGIVYIKTKTLSKTK